MFYNVIIVMHSETMTLISGMQIKITEHHEEKLQK